MDKSQTDQYREIAAINQQPVYLPNALGMQRMKWVYALLSGMLTIVVIVTWTAAAKVGQLNTNTDDIRKIRIEEIAPMHAKLEVTTTIANDNKREIDNRKENFDKMLVMYGKLSAYDFAALFSEHAKMFDMRQRGESNRAWFFREYGREAPILPEK